MIKYYIIFLFIGFGFSQDDSLGLDIIRMKSDITYKGVIIESSKTQVILKNRKNNEILKLSRKNIENISTPWSRGEEINKVSKSKRIDVNRNNEMKDFKASDIWERGFSRGFLSEKNPFSFFEWSFYKELNKFSELYFSVNTIFVANGIGFGYKYYLKDKDISSLFLNIGAYLELISDSENNYLVNGFNISPGFSFKGKPFEVFGINNNKIQKREFNKNYIIGFSLLYQKGQLENKNNPGYNSDYYIGILPYFRVEKEF